MPINRGPRICNDCSDPDAEPVLHTCRSAYGAMSTFGCLTTQLREELGLHYVRNVVQDMRTLDPLRPHPCVRGIELLGRQEFSNLALP